MCLYFTIKSWGVSYGVFWFAVVVKEPVPGIMLCAAELVGCALRDGASVICCRNCWRRGAHSVETRRCRTLRISSFLSASSSAVPHLLTAPLQAAIGGPIWGTPVHCDAQFASSRAGLAWFIDGKNITYFHSAS